MALLLDNFVVIPFVFGGLMAIWPLSQAVQVGVSLVLLVPCTDWFISFTHLARILHQCRDFGLQREQASLLPWLDRESVTF